MSDGDADERPQCKTVKTLFSFDTEYSADSVEWCPHAPLQNFFVCGNYQLAAGDAGEEGGNGGSFEIVAESANFSAESKSQRLGRILLFSIEVDGLKLHQTIDTAAILDLKWCHVTINDEILLGAVNAARTLEIYVLKSETKRLERIAKCDVKTDDKNDLLLLSLDWSTGKYANDEPNIVASDSRGNINLFKFAENNLNLINSWHAHDFEAWIAAFYYWDPNITFSGGDDCVLLKFDVRTGTEPVSKNRSHEAGVTCFHSNSEKEFLFATGSYDSYVRFWDVRKIKSPLSEMKTPGTLWRLKWDPFSYDFLLAACMLGGAHVIDARNVTVPEIIDSYYEHKNITYGSDWCYLKEDSVRGYEFDGNRIIGTCSFYDHLLCVSKLNIV